MARELDEKPMAAATLRDLGFIAIAQNRLARAKAYCEEALALREELGNSLGIAHALLGLAEVELRERNYEHATALSENVLQIAREASNEEFEIEGLFLLGRSAVRRREYDRATTLLSEALKLSVESGDVALTSDCLDALAWVASDLGHARRAASLAGAAEAMRDETGFMIHDEPEHERFVASTRAQLSDEEFDRAWQEGRQMGNDQAVEYALASGNELPDASA